MNIIYIKKQKKKEREKKTKTILGESSADELQKVVSRVMVLHI